MDVQALEEFRREKDAAFREHPRSPIPAAHRATFEGLAYFPPNPDLVFDVGLEPADGEVLLIPTSDGAERRYRRAATVRLSVEGQALQLVLLAQEEQDGYFLPFRDATSGKESYGAGRYLDVHAPQDGRVRIDFNLAYNPYCAYDAAFSCPLPPPDNWLGAPIRAGEARYARAG